MYFVIYAKDKSGQPKLRPATRPAHIEYLGGFKDRILIAGPMLGEDGEPNGSLIVVDLKDKAEAQAFAANDPYAKAGVFQSVAITAWRKSIPKD
jgi:uncharacterized protein YciI